MRSGHNSIHALLIVSKRRRRRRSNGKKRITIWRNFTLSSCVTNIKRGIAWITHQKRERASKAKSRPLLCFWMFAVYLNHCVVGFAILCFSSYLFHFFTTYFFRSMLFIVASSNRQTKWNSTNVNICTTWCRPFVYILYAVSSFFFFSFKIRFDSFSIRISCHLSFPINLTVLWMCECVCTCADCIASFDY